MALAPAEALLVPSLAEGRTQSPKPLMKKQAVKRHHHKHNLRHRYEFLETLGKGTYGKVKKARERSGKLVAIKSIRKDKIKDEQDLVHIRREIEIMSSLNHPHIIGIHEVFENNSKIVIVMEYASKGDLYDYINERQRLTEQEARHFFRQVVSAVYYCHKNGIVHRDLKLENILLDGKGNVQIADFGLSNVYQQDKFLQTYCGSPLYASPEIVNGRPYKGPEVDSWSLGVLLYILVHGTMPFDGQDYKTLVQQITSGEYREPTKLSDACGLIRWMLMVNPERRATIEDIASHWWVNWGYKVPIGEQELLRETESPLATVAEWLRRSSRPLFENSSKVRCFFKQHIPGVTLERQRSLKKSKKENDVTQALQEVALATENPSKSILKRPKGILKRRNSCEQKTQAPAPLPMATTGDTSDDRVAQTTDLIRGLSSRGLACTTDAGAAALVVPKKGILKKPQKRESGYYSSPEHTDSRDLLDSDLDASVFVSGFSPGQSPEGLPARRKGILKHNGKYSSSNTESDSDPIKGFGSFSEVALPKHPLASRAHPSSAVSEDSILSTESFDQLDLPERMPDGGGGMRSCISVDDLLWLEETEEEPGRRLRRWTVTHCQSPLRDSCFSLADCENVTDVYKQAMAISMKLS
ncbi:NUAK family SNF1-like kinase 2 [Terrapene carolina triunguis]|uniref:non-specific serine/threonine protein kinase n=1 Tax=Terrapene triunguis TaxID=2587831 RepID=A0A674IMS3_9SAUR|nr:NUAK family SNF1-like kinase 2 [Terrapene carolina triunguis]